MLAEATLTRSRAGGMRRARRSHEPAAEDAISVLGDALVGPRWLEASPHRQMIWAKPAREVLQSEAVTYGQGGARGCEARRSTSTMLRLDVRRVVKEAGGPKPFDAGDGGLHVPTGVWMWGDGGEGPSVGYELVLMSTGGALVLRYCVSGVARVDRIRLSTTPCRFGGVRWWAHCPRCHRRCAVLWGSSTAFACRACQGLAYTSSQLSKANRFGRKVRRIAEKLDVTAKTQFYAYERPRGMRRRTYARLKARLQEAKEREVLHLRHSVQGITAYLYGVHDFKPPSNAELARRRRNQRRRDRRAAARPQRSVLSASDHAID